MSLADLKVYSDYSYTAMTEIIRQKVNLFNEATNGALVLSTAANVGDFTDESHYGLVDGLVRRRNPYSSASVTEKQLTMLEETSVKIAAGTPPLRVDPAWWAWIQRSPEEAGAVRGQQLAVAAMADMLNTAIIAAVAALSNVAVVTNDASAGTADFSDLLGGAAKFGDASQEIVCWVSHSKVMFDIWGTALANNAALFSFGTINVKQDGFGRPIVLTDSPSLVNLTPTPDIYRTLGLSTGAVTVQQNGDFFQNEETKNGNENIQRTIQAEWSYNLKVKGFTWDKANGAHAPNDAAIASSANWDRVATSHKDLAGVLVLTQ